MQISLEKWNKDSVSRVLGPIMNIVIKNSELRETLIHVFITAADWTCMLRNFRSYRSNSSPMRDSSPKLVHSVERYEIGFASSWKLQFVDLKGLTSSGFHLNVPKVKPSASIVFILRCFKLNSQFSSHLLLSALIIHPVYHVEAPLWKGLSVSLK